MSSVSLIPDRQLTFSPELAETIGLEEAVLLQALGTLIENNQGWTTVSVLTAATHAVILVCRPHHTSDRQTRITRHFAPTTG